MDAAPIFLFNFDTYQALDSLAYKVTHNLAASREASVVSYIPLSAQSPLSRFLYPMASAIC